MIYSKEYAYGEEFHKYIDPLVKLEEAFNVAGMNIEFFASVDPVYGNVIKVDGGFASQKTICIEADSLVAAIKDVAAGIKIS